MCMNPIMFAILFSVKVYKKRTHRFFLENYTVFRKKHPLLFSCITLRKSPIKIKISDKIANEILILQHKISLYSS